MEYRVFGPPGTGKTQYSGKRLIPRAIELADGQIPIICSFTRAAAHIQATRAGVDPSHPNVGTLHSINMKLLNIKRDQMVYNHIKEWNDSAPEEWQLSSGKASTDDVVGSDQGGDNLLQRLDTLRAVQQDVIEDPKLARFAKAWRHWKDDTGYYDFTDLIELVLEQHIVPDAKWGIFDEAQDYTSLELAVIRMWREHIDRIVLLGDDDQCIYGFRGSTPDAFLDPPIPDKHKKILTQSYRVPRRIHEFTQQWIQQVHRRQQKEYSPRDYEGEVLQTQSTYKYPMMIVNKVQKYIAQGKTCMIVATCNRMLYQIEKELRHRGIPYHNPYVGHAEKTSQYYRWNPLQGAARKRLAAFLRAKETTSYSWLFSDDDDDDDDDDTVVTWDTEDLKLWLKDIDAAKILVRGAKELLKKKDFVDPVNIFRAPPKKTLDFFMQNLLSSKWKAYKYVARVHKQGYDLDASPKVVVGTIHSVKGAESDIVFVFPDISFACAKALKTQAARDALRRVFYVAFTRARETLYLCSPCKRTYMRWR